LTAFQNIQKLETEKLNQTANKIVKKERTAREQVIDINTYKPAGII
jgi:hypothetical protein